jgi:hypothetical protein
MKILLSTLTTALLLTASSFASVTVSSPQAGVLATPQARFVAKASTDTCAKGVAAMGIYLDNKLAYQVDGTSLNTSLAIPAGKHNAVVQAWDYCGGATLTAVSLTGAGQTGVSVTSPVNNSTVNWLSTFAATATTTCEKGVASMGIYVNSQLIYTVAGATLNTPMNLAPGTQHTVVQEWDNCGGSSYTPIDVAVQGSGNTFKNLQSSPGWNSWAQLAPVFADCSAPCSGVTWSMTQGIKSPSLSGNSAQMDLGGTTPYSDVLFENPLIGAFSTQGLPDTKQTLIPTLNNFTYDADFYMANGETTQAMEFDVNMFPGKSVGMTWGTECRIEGGHEWDIWDNAHAKWMPTGMACNPSNNGWNHVTVNVQRGPNNTLIYQSIVLNGTISNLNKTYPPFTVPSNWYGITVNYQMDGDQNQTKVRSYVDNFTFMYW